MLSTKGLKLFSRGHDIIISVFEPQNQSQIVLDIVYPMDFAFLNSHINMAHSKLENKTKAELTQRRKIRKISEEKREFTESHVKWKSQHLRSERGKWVVRG